MKKLICSLIVLLIAVNAMGQGWEWAKEAGQAVSREAYICATDRWNNVYGVGQGVLIAKYDSSGTQLWTGSCPGFPSCAQPDPFGNLYVLAIYTNDSIVVASQTLHSAHYPGYQYYLAKFDINGNLLWGKNIGTVNTLILRSYPHIVCDSQANIYFTCPYSGHVTLGAYSFTDQDLTDSTNDVLVSKLDSSGNALWAKSYGGKKDEQSFFIGLTTDHDIYIAGNFNSDTLAFGSTILTDTGTGIEHNNLFVCKLSSNGDPIWAKQRGGSCEVAGVTGFTTAPSGDAYITGYFSTGSVIFGTDTFVSPIITYKTYGFLVKYDTSGSVVWTKLYQIAVPRSVATDRCGNVWTAGWTDSTSIIDGHIFNAPSKRYDISFISGWTSDGSFINGSDLASGGDDEIGISLDNAGNAYICSDFAIDTFYVGPDTLFCNPGEFMFTAKYLTGSNCIFPEKIIQPYPLSNLTLYPNPATSSITIQYNNPTQNTTAGIYDITGRLMGSYLLTGSNTTISVQNLPPGIYQCRVMDRGHNVVTKKLVIMH